MRVGGGGELLSWGKVTEHNILWEESEFSFEG